MLGRVPHRSSKEEPSGIAAARFLAPPQSGVCIDTTWAKNQLRQFTWQS